MSANVLIRPTRIRGYTECRWFRLVRGRSDWSKNAAKHMQMQLTVELRILDERIRTWGVPRHQSDMAAGIDLVACLDEPLTLEPQSAAVLVPTGIAIHIGDPNVAAVIVPRSGLGHKRGLVLGNLVGVVDADYTGQLAVSCWNRSAATAEAVTIDPGDRIAQLLFLPILRPTICVVEEFSRSSVRGSGGFGSTGYRFSTEA